MEAVNIPTITECIRLMEQYEMLENIRHHSLVVARIADLLVDGLQNMVGDHPVPDRNLVIAGALLHDIAKTPCLKNACDHALAGAEICDRHGYPEIARIVEEHVILKDHDPVRYEQGHFTAREIVYYADKRVRHTEIVSLDDRLIYILEHYGNGDSYIHERIRENFNKCVQIEQFMFRFLSFTPDGLAGKINELR